MTYKPTYTITNIKSTYSLSPSLLYSRFKRQLVKIRGNHLQLTAVNITMGSKTLWAAVQKYSSFLIELHSFSSSKIMYIWGGRGEGVTSFDDIYYALRIRHLLCSLTATRILQATSQLKSLRYWFRCKYGLSCQTNYIQQSDWKTYFATHASSSRTGHNTFLGLRCQCTVVPMRNPQAYTLQVIGHFLRTLLQPAGVHIASYFRTDTVHAHWASCIHTPSTSHGFY